MSKRLEEIKNKYGGSFRLHVKEDSPGMDILWLIEKLEKAIEMAKFYEKYKDDGLRACDFLKELE
ncbi:MAG TPA: hypothetical protein PK473_03165 [Nitrosomonas sp.]|nr:hypothetical protein [Nitrosomonas sp.]